MEILTISKLISNKTKQFTLTLNYTLIEKFKIAAKANNFKPTQLIEIWMIEYLDKNGYLND